MRSLARMAMNSHLATSRAAAASLMTLCKEEESTRAEVVREGGITLAVSLCRTGDPEAQAHAAEALALLSHHRHLRAALIDGAAVPALLHLALSEKEQVKTAAAKALSHLGKERVVREQLVQSRPFARLVTAAKNNSGKDTFFAYLSLLSLE
mmetsp:Transcript_26665/g.63368  ORF Transcript_26665/g.63368 Transcript_26665/m.63368 type:complete len:152 (+) Transcript_26665:1-456(+)